MEEFSRIQRLPAYVFNITGDMKMAARRRGEDIIDFGMGNPDGATPKHIVDKLVEAALKPVTHRYSVSKGIPRLRKAICNWYKTRYDVDLDPDTEAIVTIGSKEGIAHLCLAILDSRDTVLVPNPSYPIHIYGPVIAGAHIISVPVHDQEQFLAQLEDLIPRMTPRPKALIVNFPSIRRRECVDLPFLARLVELAREYGFHLIHDLAYADIALRRLQAAQRAAGSRRQGCGGRVLYPVQELQHARLARGIHGRQPEAGGCAGAAQELLRLRNVYADSGCVDSGSGRPAGVRARDLRDLSQAPRCAGRGLNRMGWPVAMPKATMFVWAQIPEQYRKLGSLEFSKLLLTEAKTAVSPGIGFGDYGDGHVRFSLIENEERTRQALRGIKQMLAKGVLVG